MTKSTIQQSADGTGALSGQLALRAKPSFIKAKADPRANSIEITSDRVRKLKLRLMPGLYDPEKPLVVTWNGNPVFKGKLDASARTVLEEARSSGRRDRAIIATLSLVCPR